MAETDLARLTIAADTAHVAAVRDLVAAIARTCGLEAAALPRLELVVEEACLWIIETGFDPGEAGRYEVEVSRRSDALVIGFSWRGLPFDPDRLPEDSAAEPSLALMRAFAEEIRFRNLGKDGMRIELARSLPARAIDQYPGITRDAAGTVPPPATDATTLRVMTPDDAFALSRCVYRSYGYTYADFAYYPDRVREMLESGRMASIVAINEADELVGHIAMLRRDLDKPVAESGVAVVDPRYRGRALFKTMKVALGEEAGRRGLFGLFSDAVTRHPMSQKGNVSLGAVETGLMLGYVPPGLGARFISEAEADADRAAVMLFWFTTARPPERRLFPPDRHRAMIAAIYGRLDLPRAMQSAGDAPDASDAAGDAAIDLTLRPDIRVAFAALRRYGRDTGAQLQAQLGQLCRQGMAVIYLDLPLGRPETAEFCPVAEALGFTFAGIVPEYDQGDVLRLQYLNGVPVDPTRITTASPAGEALKDYVLAQLPG